MEYQSPYKSKNGDLYGSMKSQGGLLPTQEHFIFNFEIFKEGRPSALKLISKGPST